MSKKQTDNTEQLTLPFVADMIEVHCFFRCSHIAIAVEPQEAHDLMERHYTEKHSHQIERIVGTPEQQKRREK